MEQDGLFTDYHQPLAQPPPPEEREQRRSAVRFSITKEEQPQHEIENAPSNWVQEGYSNHVDEYTIALNTAPQQFTTQQEQQQDDSSDDDSVIYRPPSQRAVRRWSMEHQSMQMVQRRSSLDMMHQTKRSSMDLGVGSPSAASAMPKPQRRASVGGFAPDSGTNTRRRILSEFRNSAKSYYNRSDFSFFVAQSDIVPKEIVDWFDLPKYEIAKVDHTASIAGGAFSHGYVQQKVEVRKPAMEMIALSFEKFHYRKSFWTIVPKIPPPTKSIIFCDDQRRRLRKDTSEGDHESCDFSYSSTNNSKTEEEEIEECKFYVQRVTESVVLARGIENEQHIAFCDELDITDLPMPAGYDLLINPFFFGGDNYPEEVAQDCTCSVERDDHLYGSTLVPATGQGFLLLFGMVWQDLVHRITDLCKAGLEVGMEWPRFLEKIKSQYGPAPDYYDIPKGYYNFASGMLLGFYENVGVRELWAAGGLIGMYSFARRVPSIESQRDFAVIFAMLREAAWGCRSKKLGIRLLHLLPASYQNDFVAFCTYPWSNVDCISKEKAWTTRRIPHKKGRRRHRPSFSILSQQKQSEISNHRRRFKKKRETFLARIKNYCKFGDYYKATEIKTEDVNRVQVISRRYLMTVEQSQSRAFMNFVAGVGMEMLGKQYPTLIEDRMNVISDSFESAEEAKSELRFFSNREKMLPGAVLRAANCFETDGGVLNVVQERDGKKRGHIEWVRKYSYFDAIITLLMLGFATVLGWRLNTGVFHFLMALTVLTRIAEEVAIFGTFYVICYGRRYGHKMHEDTVAQFFVPAALGAVEGAYELIPEDNLWVAKLALILAGGFAGGIVFFTLVARLRYRDTKGRTYEEVLERDGSIECLLTGESETGLRSIDHPNGPGVGPLQAQLRNLCESNGGDIASSTAAAPYHLSGHWMIAGTLQMNHEVDFGTSGAVLHYTDEDLHEVELLTKNSMNDDASSMVFSTGESMDNDMDVV